MRLTCFRGLNFSSNLMRPKHVALFYILLDFGSENMSSPQIILESIIVLTCQLFFRSFILIQLAPTCDKSFKCPLLLSWDFKFVGKWTQSLMPSSPKYVPVRWSKLLKQNTPSIVCEYANNQRETQSSFASLRK